MADKVDTQKAYCPACEEEFDAAVDFCPHDGEALYKYQLRDSGSDDPLLGRELDGRFRLERVLGQGGMGKVYQGVQLSVGRQVAIKVLHEDLCDDEMVIRRFFREARVISGFAHPGIVNLVDFGQEENQGLLYLVMELVSGRPLSRIVARGRLALEPALDIAAQVCGALAEPHGRKVVHRDLKPENLMLLPIADGSVQVKVLDFGIASALQTDTKLTQTGTVCGTAHYMAPEQAQGQDVAAATDIYALGVILFEMLSGQLPFEADAPLQLMLKHVQVQPPSLRELVSEDEVPDEVVFLVDRMLRKPVSGRPDSVLDVRDEIEAIQRQYGLGSVRVDANQDLDEMFDAWIVTKARGQRLSQSDQVLPVSEIGTKRRDTGGGAPAVGGESEMAFARTAASEPVQPVARPADSTPSASAAAQPSESTEHEWPPQSARSDADSAGPGGEDIELPPDRSRLMVGLATVGVLVLMAAMVLFSLLRTDESSGETQAAEGVAEADEASAVEASNQPATVEEKTGVDDEKKEPAETTVDPGNQKTPAPAQKPETDSEQKVEKAPVEPEPKERRVVEKIADEDEVEQARAEETKPARRPDKTKEPAPKKTKAAQESTSRPKDDEDDKDDRPTPPEPEPRDEPSGEAAPDDSLDLFPME